tara:strand:+ start:1503 stop:2786 length:1284 start_codon:yes stop_codon:yes gene_type:complete
MTNELLQELQTMVEKLGSTTSNNDKKAILETYGKNEEVVKLLEYTYSTYRQYYVTSKNCKKKSELCHEQYLGDIFTMLDNLHNRVWTGHEAISYVNGFVHNHPEYEETIWKIIDRDLKCRVSTALINKVIPNTIPVFKVALAEKMTTKLDFENEDWYASRKLDGVRCIIRKEGDVIKAFSRNGKEFWTLGKVIDEVKTMDGDFVLDGEICIMDGDNEDFQSIMKEIRRKDHIVDNPKFVVFDCLSTREFDNQLGTRTLIERLEDVEIDFSNNDFQYLDLLKQDLVKDEEHMLKMSEDADNAGHEGIMLRKDTTYEGKRSKNLLKVKKFHDAEYKVIDLEFGKMRVVENGEEVEEEMLSNVIVEHKGNRVGVGSGFSIAQRRDFYKNTTKILDKIVTVTYFEESQNQNGDWSLRFPVLKCIHGDKRLV